MSDRSASVTGSVSRKSELNPSETNQLMLAQANSRSGNCPVSMPRIKSAVVFQSVEAPQIEPMRAQAKFPYNNYDLVMGKASWSFD